MIQLALLALLSQAAPPQAHAIYKSVDRGLTWSKAGAGLPGNPRINAFGATANGTFAGTDAGIFRSTDEGKTWRTTSVTARTLSFATSGATIYAGTQSHGLFASHDQGLTWTAITSLRSKNIRSLLAADDGLFAGTDGEGVMVSRDRGTTWAAHNAGLPPLSQIFAMARIDDTIFVGLYAKGLYAWRMNESRWTEAGKVKPLVIAASGGALAVGHNPGGVFWSAKPDSAAWTKATGDFGSVAPVWAMASDRKLAIAGVGDGVFLSNDGGRSWSRTLKGLPARSSGVSFLVHGNTIYAGLVISAASPKAGPRHVSHMFICSKHVKDDSGARCPGFRPWHVEIPSGERRYEPL